jgi:hypothetical protein
MGKQNDDVLEAQFVEINDQSFRVDVVPVNSSRVPSPQASEMATKQQLSRVPAVTDLPSWEDG